MAAAAIAPAGMYSVVENMLESLHPRSEIERNQQVQAYLF